jgi:hypothetical protein
MTGELDELAFLFPCIVAACRADLTWMRDWTQYPTSDLDLIVFGINAALDTIVYIDFRGASLNSPENTSIDRADPVWTLGDPNNVAFTVYDVDGFDTNGNNEPYTFDWYAPPAP